MKIETLLETAIQQQADEIHFASGETPRILVSGHLCQLNGNVLSLTDALTLMRSIAPERCQEQILKTGNTNFGFVFEDQAFRVSVFQEKLNIRIVLRRIDGLDTHTS